MKPTLRVLFGVAMAAALLIGTAGTGVADPRCFLGPEQTVSDMHGEPSCSWAQMHACTKARWQIDAICAEGWVETSVTQSPCVQQPNGNFRSTCTITFKCETCIDDLCGPLIP